MNIYLQAQVLKAFHFFRFIVQATQVKISPHLFQHLSIWGIKHHTLAPRAEVWVKWWPMHPTEHNQQDLSQPSFQELIIILCLDLYSFQSCFIRASCIYRTGVHWRSEAELPIFSWSTVFSHSIIRFSSPTLKPP